jgi:hypothetical protein
MEFVLLLCGFLASMHLLRTNGLKVLSNITPALTALGTCIATIPANLEATKDAHTSTYRNIAIPLERLYIKTALVCLLLSRLLLFCYVRKDFTDPHTLLIALGIIIVSVVEGGIPNGGYIGEILAITIYGFPMEQVPAAMIVGTFGSDGNIVKCEWRRSFSDVDYPNFGREEVAFKHVDYIIYRRNFYQTAVFFAFYIILNKYF